MKIERRIPEERRRQRKDRLRVKSDNKFSE